MQVEVKPRFFQSFGGINFIEADYRKMQLSNLIVKFLGYRSPNAVYSFADIIKAVFYLHIIGGDVLDDVNTLQQQLSDHPGLPVCSADTIEYVCQELRQPNRETVTEKGVIHTVNEHEGFNRLLSAICRQAGILQPGTTYTMDYDGHIVENTKPDNARNYKKSEGYYPVVCSINKLPVYMQNRNGNTPESHEQLPVISAAIGLCRQQDIMVAKFRADASCYEKQTVLYLEQQAVQYYIRAELNAALRIALQDEQDWKEALLNNKKVEVCSIEHFVFGGYRRIVAYRNKAAGQLTIDQDDGYSYQAILTSDGNNEAMSVIEFYNQRGCQGEHHFKELDYDFGWSKLPFDNIAMNTVYMYVTIISYLLFNIFKTRYAAKTNFVTPQMRLKNFILHFVTLTAKWIKTGRQLILKIYTTKDYSAVFQT